MKYCNPLLALGAALLFGFGNLALAAEPGAADSMGKTELQEELRAEYQQALSIAKRDRLVAEAAMEKVRETLQLAAEQRGTAMAKSEAEQKVRAEELEKMHQELKNARRQLQEASREIARVNREVARIRSDRDASAFIMHTSDRPVIGVILGEADDTGIKVLGVSPDGPSERAGIQPGDIIVSLGGHELTAIDDKGNVKSSLNNALQEIKAAEPIIVSVLREDKTLDVTVVPEIREPLSWQTITRFPTSPDSPEKVVRIERIEVPQLDTEALSEQIEKIRIEIEERGELLEAGAFAPHDKEYEIQFHELSDLGDFALHDANFWFGLPLAQGLKLSEINPGLGEYFKTDRGVLVLSAKANNKLQLMSGDVILQVGDTAVNSPAKFMRALRDFHSGDELKIDIKRKRKNLTLTTIMPESQTSFYTPGDSRTHTINITTKQD
jgi:C-terminal processing protease CtpA/Prc